VTADAATINLTITETAQGTFHITENGNPVGGGTGDFSGVTGSILLRLSNANDTGAVIDLGGFNIRSLYANLGGGANDLTVEHGTLLGYLNASGGPGGERRAVRRGRQRPDGQPKRLRQPERLVQRRVSRQQQCGHQGLPDHLLREQRHPRLR